ncbi:hypothetical protein F66182_10584 [Fusarium sp. NRRL 66182]|nr:hypothetical protein F66182_10584 [Fusarium sp. NRRL 66182]
MQVHGHTISDKTGHEMTIQTNLLSNALLTLLLSKIMQEGLSQRRDGDRPPVITIVGSDTMYMSRLEVSGPILPYLDDPALYQHSSRYIDSKLLIMLFVAKLAEKISPNRLIISVCNPGMTAGTNLLKTEDKEVAFTVRWIFPAIVKVLGRSLKVGASNYIHALLAGPESHGSFISEWQICPSFASLHSRTGTRAFRILQAGNESEVILTDLVKPLHEKLEVLGSPSPEWTNWWTRHVAAQLKLIHIISSSAIIFNFGSQTMSAKLEKDAAWEGSVVGSLYRQVLVRPPPVASEIRLDGQTAIITGSNRGLGFEAARQLLQLGVSYLILAVRSQKKGDAAALKLREECGSAKIDVGVVDMADYNSIMSFVDRCRKLDRIDYVVLNAGFMNTKFERNDRTGHESVLQTNYLSTALLGLELAKVMEEKRHASSQPPVLSVVGSDSMYLSNFNPTGPIFACMDDPTQYSMFAQYLASKLMVMMFFSRLAESFNNKDIIINVCNPGMTAGTGADEDAEKPSFAVRCMRFFLVKTLARSVEAGASNYVYALIFAGPESHGSFVSEWTVKPYPALMYKNEGKDLVERLWQETVAELRDV